MNPLLTRSEAGADEVTTGTVLVAAKFKDGVVLGADSRSVKGTCVDVWRAWVFE